MRENIFKLILGIAFVSLVLTGCGGSMGGIGGGEIPGDDGGGAAPTPPTDAPTPIEFNSIIINKSLSVVDFADIVGNGSELNTPTANFNEIQDQFIKVNEILDYTIEPTEGMTSWEDEDDYIHVDFTVRITGYSCSGNATTLPVCLVLYRDANPDDDLDGNLMAIMRYTVFGVDEEWIQWLIFDPDGTTLDTIEPTPERQENLQFIKTTYSDSVIGMSSMGNVEWDSVPLSDLEVEFEVSELDSGNIMVKGFKNDWYSDTVQINVAGNSNHASVHIQVNSPDGIHVETECVDSGGAPIDPSNCEDDASGEAFVGTPVNIVANDVVGPANSSAAVGDGELTISWNAMSGASSYNLYYDTTSGITKSNGTKIEGVATPFTHTALINGVDYYYRVTAVVDGAETLVSDEVTNRPQVDTVGTEFFDEAVVLDLTPGTGYDYAMDVAVDSQNRIYLTGTSHLNATDTSRMFLIRYRPDGDFDTTFNAPYATPADGDEMDGESIFIDDDTNIYVFGNSTIGGTTYLTIWKYTATGALDISFNRDGYMIEGFVSHANAGMISSENETIIGGYSVSDSLEGTVWGYLEDILDIDFANNGYYTYDHPTLSNTIVYDIVLDDSDRIYFTGYSFTTDEPDKQMVLGRLLSDGTLDVGSGTTRGFGDDYDDPPDGFADGYVLFNSDTDDYEDDNPEAVYYGYGVTVGPDKKIWVGGKCYVNSEAGKGFIWRYNVDGELDSTFGEDNGDGTRKGYRRLIAAGSYVYVNDIVFDGYGRVIVGTQRGPDAAVWRLDMNGDFDIDFGGGDGLVIFGAGNSRVDVPWGVNLDIEGNIVMGGHQREGDPITTAKIQMWKIQ